MSAHRRHLRRAILATPLALLALVSASGSAAAPTGFAVGGVPALQSGSVTLGAVTPSTPLSLTVVLAPRDPAALAAAATAASTPGSPGYHHYLTAAQFAARYGATPAAVASVGAVLRSAGLAPGALAPDGLSLSVTGDAADASLAFDVSLRRYRERDGRDVFANTTAPRLPPSLQGVVAGVLGLDDVAVAAPVGLAVPDGAATAGAAQSTVPGPETAGPPSPCSQASSHAGSHGPYTINEIADAYGMAGLYADQDLGSGVTVALYELEPYTAGDVSAFQSCFGTSADVTDVAVDGGPGSPSGSDPGLETALDLENVIGIAPASSIRVYQGPDSGNGPYDTLQAIVDDPHPAEVVSDSWGLCELDLLDGDPSLFAAENTLFEQAATEGQSFLVASGDHGSEGCVGSSPNTGDLSVDDPASQPYATGVGGTALTSLASPATQTVWEDGSGAGGGGISAVWSMPSYQSASNAPGVISQYSSGTPCGAASGYCREVPDVSADAAPSTGYLVYYSGNGHAGWYDVGGTSGAAPVWAGLAALADASGEGTCADQPLGFLNPSLYAIAAGAGAATAFDDVVSGDNSPSGSGDYPAAAGYDMASGLGTPIAADGSGGLVAQLCGVSGATQPPATPSVTGVSPSEAAPGSTVTITGSGFAGPALVDFGASPATNVTVAGSGQLTATVPAGGGTVDVTVTTGGATSATGAADRFTYAPAATIAAPAAGAVYTQGQRVSAAYSCTAATPDVQCAAPVLDGSPLNTSQIGPQQFTVTATDGNGASTSQTVAYAVIAPPAVAIAAPVAGATYVQGRRVAASFSCATTVPITIAACSAPVASGAALDTATPGPHSFTVTATDSNGVTTTAAAAYTVLAAEPTIARLRQSAATWVERRSGGARLPVGTTFSFSLDQAATVTLRFTRIAAGRESNGRCVAATVAAVHARRCTRTLGAGSVSLRAAGGADRLFFSGRTSVGALSAGSYRVTLTAVGAAGAPSAAATLSFTVAAPRG